MSVEATVDGKKYIRCQCNGTNEWQETSKLELKPSKNRKSWQCPRCKHWYAVESDFRKESGSLAPKQKT